MPTPYTYPTPAMLEGYRSQVNAGIGPRDIRGGQLVPLDASNLGAPNAAPGKVSFWQRVAILIGGADAARVLFPPQQPLQPIAQPIDYAALGRPWDYPVGWNTRVTPRTGKVPFAALREMAAPDTGYDVLRLLIERTKDKLLSQAWAFVPRDKEAKADERCDLLEDFFAYPDKVNTFNDWFRMLLEQLLVYDAPAVWLRPTRGGELYGLEIIDGAMISPKIMGDGRLPPPEYGPAYQQVIKGLPAVDYIQPVPKGQPVPTDGNGQAFPELLYKPRNRRIDSLYGYGPVEQIMTTVYIAHARQEYMLRYYKDGTTADEIFGVPPEWNPDQIAQFQANWNATLAGNLANRRQTQFVPGGFEHFNIRSEALTDESDQWLIRICCFAFGLNPMPFIKQMNKGQEQTHHEEAIQEGLEPWQKWFVDFVNTIVYLKFGWRDLTFHWREDDPVDPVDQAKIDSSDVQSAIYHPDEIRAKRGDDPMADDLRAQMAMANFRNAPNATLFTDEQQASADERKAVQDAARAANMKPAAPAVADKLGKGQRSRSSRSTASGVLY